MLTPPRPLGATVRCLRGVGLKATRQRLMLLGLLLGRGNRPVTADELFQQAQEAGIPVSRATVYNTLHALVRHGLLRAITIDSERTWFDTDTAHIGRLYCEASGRMEHLPPDTPGLKELLRHLGDPPPGRVEVLVRVRADGNDGAPSVTAPG